MTTGPRQQSFPRPGRLWLVAALLLGGPAALAEPGPAGSATAPDARPLHENKDAAMMASYFRGYLMARYCLNNGVEFSADEVDRVQDELNNVADASPLSDQQKAQIWHALQSNLNSMGGEVTAEDCGRTRQSLVALMPQAIMAKPTDP